MTEPPTSPVATYATVRGDVARDHDTLLAIWQGNLPDQRDREHKFNWFYRDASPWGATLFRLLRHEPSGTWVGTAAIGRRHMRYRGQDIRAGILADMTVDARHRSLGPAMMLQESLSEAALGEFDLLYGFPNPTAAVVMRRLGYFTLAQLPRFTRVLRHHVYLGRHLPRVLARLAGWCIDTLRRVQDAAWRFPGPVPRVSWSMHADPRMDALWQHSAPGDTLMAPRTVALLQWRFDRFPAGNTRYLLLSDPGNGRLLAWFACQQASGHLHVRDFWSDDAADGVGRGYIAALVRAARAEGCAAVDISCAAPAPRLDNWRALGFVEREHRLIVGQWLDGRIQPESPPDDYHFTSADEDG